MDREFKNNYSEKIINGIKTRLFKKNEKGENVFSDELNSMFNYTEKEFKKIFNGNSKTWLRKEMSRWRDNAFKENTKMKGTLFNLELLCFLAKCEPNDILLDGTTHKSITANTQYLSLDALKGICESLININQELKEVKSSNDDLFENSFLEDALLLPVEFSPTAMRFLFLKIYKDSDDIKMQYVLNEYVPSYEGIAPSEDNIITFNITSQKNGKLTLEKFYNEKNNLLNNDQETDAYTDYILSIDNCLKKVLTEKKLDDFFFQLYYNRIKESEDNLYY